MTKLLDKVDDDGSFECKFALKKFNADKCGLEFDLTRSQMARLMIKAGIRVSQWSKGVFDLARIGDAGGYTWGNCRFISHGENIRERVLSNTTRSKLIRNAKKNTRLKTPYYDDPEYYREVFSSAGKKGGASLGKKYLERISSEVDRLLSTRMDIIEVGYPRFGWKGRLSKEWGITKRRLDTMLRHRPTLVRQLKN